MKILYVTYIGNLLQRQPFYKKHNISRNAYTSSSLTLNPTYIFLRTFIFDPLKSEIHLNISKCSSYLKENTTHLYYNDQLLYAV
jgi:hypothetical protein